MKHLRIGFIGGGNMAEALIAGLVRAGHAPEALTVVDVDEARLAVLRDAWGVTTTSSHLKAVAGAQAVVLAVKPQQMDEALGAIAPGLDADATVISIAAGVGIARLRRGLGRDVALVRVMPNTPCLVGAGMSVLYSEAKAEHRARAEYVLGSSGRTAWVDDEDMLHAVTAVSGSGPAYFFLLAELMQAAAKGLGLPEDLSRELVAQTALGAGRMLAETGKSAGELRQQVTSPGGTTQAALETMFEAGLPDTVRAAVAAAARRSRELA